MFRPDLRISALLLTGLLAAPTSAQERPNVLLIDTNDQGTIDLNRYGAEDLIMPNLDGLAALATSRFIPRCDVDSAPAGAIATTRVLSSGRG